MLRDSGRRENPSATAAQTGCNHKIEEAVLFISRLNTKVVAVGVLNTGGKPDWSLLTGQMVTPKDYRRSAYLLCVQNRHRQEEQTKRFDRKTITVSNLIMPRTGHPEEVSPSIEMWMCLHPSCTFIGCEFHIRNHCLNSLSEALIREIAQTFIVTIAGPS